MRTLRLLGATCAIYAGLWLLAGVWVDADRQDGGIDSRKGDHNIYRTPIREVIYNLPALCRRGQDRRHLFVIGGSTAKAYRPEILTHFLPNWTVSNISLDFGNITQARQAVSLLRQCLGDGAFARAKFVLGIEYILFSENKRRWATPYTVLETEMLRHGLFAGSPGNLVPIVPWQWQPFAISLMRPIFAAYGIRYDIWQVMIARANKLGDHLNALDAEKRRDREYANLVGLMGPAEPAVMQEQREELDRLIAEIHGQGAQFFLLDMPVQEWLRQRSPHFTMHRGWIRDYAHSRRVGYVDMTFDGVDEDFADGIHANAQGAERWSDIAGRKLADALLREEVEGASGS